MNILISGIAGDIGFGVGRILRDWGISKNLIGIDTGNEHPGKLLFDSVLLAPRAMDPSYIDWLHNLITEYKVDLFIPTSEAEISVISKNIDVITKITKVLINAPSLIDICMDKHAMLLFLSSQGVRVPDHGLMGVDTPINFPVIVKPRRGRGSKDIKQIDSVLELSSDNDGEVWQELLLPAEQEFTCAVYVRPNLETRILQLKRTLVGGYTGKAEVFDNSDISKYIQDIVNIFKIHGCFNIQLRLTKQGPLLFEINPRLSSTLVFRDKLGFMDLRWWICDKLGLEAPSYKRPKIKTKIYRGNIEYIV
ncbi:MAG: hypothetical protein CMF40_02250 [Legionellales bacterium]|mgnify:CR=1 FL=1|nr:hypothetical protein [Legionellales bacterium]